jgi:hypothetical protein
MERRKQMKRWNLKRGRNVNVCSVLESSTLKYQITKIFFDEEQLSQKDYP